MWPFVRRNMTKFNASISSTSFCSVIYSKYATHAAKKSTDE